MNEMFDIIMTVKIKMRGLSPLWLPTASDVIII